MEDEDIYEWDQPISDLIKGFRNYEIKWGSKDINNDVLLYNRTMENFDHRDYRTMYLINDLCKNTVIASMAINALIKFIYVDYEKAIETNDEELKYVCWIRYQKTIRLAEEMNLGSGAYGKTHATFDNISDYTARGIHSLFLFKFKKNLSDRDLNRLESIYDTFDDVSKERKEEIKKICGESYDIQIDPNKRYYEEYERK